MEFEILMLGHVYALGDIYILSLLMKQKSYFLLILVVISLGINIPGVSQQMKIGVFDLDSMVHALPQYKIIDSIILAYDDTAAVNYELLVKELSGIDNVFLNPHSTTKGYRDSLSERRNQIAFSIIYWKSNSEQIKKEKARILSEPLYKKCKRPSKKLLPTEIMTLF